MSLLTRPGEFLDVLLAKLSPFYVRDVVELANQLIIPVAILSFDQEKALHAVDWPFLFATLGKMGFGVSFIRWVRFLYTDVRSSVLIIGYCFRAFRPSRGCPLSPLLYILSFEVLAANIRCNSAISGLRLPGISSPLPVLSLHADDTSVISCSDRATKVLFEVYHRFEKGTGAKLNIGKCEGVWLGAWRGHLDKPVPIQWFANKGNVLGVYIGNDNLEEANWQVRINAEEKCLNS